MGGSPTYRSSPFHPYFFRPSSPPPPRRSVISIPVSDRPSPTPPPAPSTPAPPRLTLSAAASIIQSHYRGFAIRRRTPLLHLRTLASVQRQLDLLHSDLQRGDFANAIRGSEKERFRVTETIMALLLQLDAIEGAVPEIRSRRKQVTRKAIQLQEAIDGMWLETQQKPIDGLLQEPEQQLQENSEAGEAVYASDNKPDTASGSAVERMIDKEERGVKVGEVLNSDVEKEYVASGLAVDEMIDPDYWAGPNGPALSIDLINSEKVFCSDDKLADDRSNTSNAKMDPSLQDTVQEQVVRTQIADFSTADGNNSETCQRLLQQECSARLANYVDIGNNFERGKVTDETGGVNVPQESYSSAISENANAKEQSGHLIAAGRHLKESSNHCAIENSVASTLCHHCQTDDRAVDNSSATNNSAAEGKAESLQTMDVVNVGELHSKQDIANNTDIWSGLPDIYPDQLATREKSWDVNTERPDAILCQSENHEMKLSTGETCEKQTVSSAISTQEAKCDDSSDMVDGRSIACLAQNPSSQGREVLVSDRELLEQLCEDSKSMKLLLAKLHMHSRTQMKTIDSLNKRVEKLEHLLHREKLKNRKQTQDKRTHRNGKGGRKAVWHDVDCKHCETLLCSNV